MGLQEVLAHAHLPGWLVTDPILLVIPVSLEALTSSAYMAAL